MLRNEIAGSAANSGGWSQDRFLRWGGQCNPLKRLIPAKETQGNPSLFSLIGFARICLAWPDFEQFGVDLEDLIRTAGRFLYVFGELYSAARARLNDQC
jgi:hypothetical protein